MKTKVLVTGAGAVLGQGIIKSLRLSGAAYHVIAADPDPRSAGLFWADAAYLLPLAQSPDYLPAVRRILEQERPQAVLIGTDVELLAFAIHREELEAEFGTKVVVSSPEVIRIADDKWLTYRFLLENGFPHPRTALPEQVGELLSACDYPLVVKPRVGARSVGVQLVKDQRQLRAALEATENAVVQECVATERDEFTSGILASGDRAHAVVTMRRDLKDGNTYRAYVQPDSPYDPFLAEVARKLRGFGPLNFQFRVAGGAAKIFEINARFSGTTPLRAYAGFNEVHCLLRHLLFGEPVPRPSLREAVILRYWDEVVVDPDQVSALSSERSIQGPWCRHPFSPPDGGGE